MNFLSYAQNQEDVMLYRALRQVEKGFYIDVGAQHPINDSVTKAFYERGWHGINIDPVPQWIELLREDRPHDINLQIALGAHSEHKQMFALQDTGLSTDNPVFLQRHLDAGYVAESIEIQVETLDAICQRYDVATVHFLKIDVEGAETAVIRGFSFDRIRPWIVLVEAVEPVSDPAGQGGLEAVASYQEWEPLLLARDYLFAYDDGLNRFYVAAEKQELLKHFNVPANALDVFVRYQEWLKHERILKLDSEVRALTDATALASRRAELEGLDALRRDSENRLQRIGVLEQECAVLQGRMAATQSELDQWRGRYEAAEQRLVRLAEVEQRLARSAQREELREAEIAENHRHAQNRLQRISELEQQIASVQGQLRAIETERSELRDLRVVAEQRALRVADLEHRINANANIQSELEGLRGKFADLSRHSADQDALLHTIVQSRSWRLTRPLRWLRRGLSLREPGAATTVAGPIPAQTGVAASALVGARGKAFLKRVLLGMMRQGRSHPALQRTAGRLLSVAPRTKTRLIAMMQSHGVGYASPNAGMANPIGDRNGYASRPGTESSPAVNVVYERMRRAWTIDDAKGSQSHERDIQG